jgi:hypothetical protein
MIAVSADPIRLPEPDTQKGADPLYAIMMVSSSIPNRRLIHGIPFCAIQQAGERGLGA